MKFHSVVLYLLVELIIVLVVASASEYVIAKEQVSIQDISTDTLMLSRADAEKFDKEAKSNSESRTDERSRAGLALGEWIITAVSLIAFGAMLVIVVLGFSSRSGRVREGAIRAVAVLFITYCAIILAVTHSYTETITAIASLLSATIGYMYGRSAADDSPQQQVEKSGGDEKPSY